MKGRIEGTNYLLTVEINKASKHGDVISDPKRELKKKGYKSNSHPYTCTILFHVIGNRNVVI